jgi:hypothetical protein
VSQRQAKVCNNRRSASIAAAAVIDVFEHSPCASKEILLKKLAETSSTALYLPFVHFYAVRVTIKHESFATLQRMPMMRRWKVCYLWLVIYGVESVINTICARDFL